MSHLSSDISLFPLAKFRVSGKSMLPNFSDQTTVLVNKIAYIFRQPQVNDVIVLKHPKTKKNLLKRITRVSGEKYFVEGDNKTESTDSRDFGFITKKTKL